MGRTLEVRGGKPQYLNSRRPLCTAGRGALRPRRRPPPGERKSVGHGPEADLDLDCEPSPSNTPEPCWLEPARRDLPPECDATCYRSPGPLPQANTCTRLGTTAPDARDLTPSAPFRVRGAHSGESLRGGDRDDQDVDPKGWTDPADQRLLLRDVPQPVVAPARSGPNQPEPCSAPTSVPDEK
jgi:hypothetical protein